MNDSPLALEATSLSKRFGRKLALHDLTLRVPRGGVHAVVGSNGAGKSTFFRILLGVLAPSAGSSRVLGEDSQRLTPSTRGRIGLVTEEHTLPEWMTVAGLTAMQRQLYPRWDDDAYMEVVGHFNVLPEQRVAQLSRGERAGLNLAMALAQAPDLLILDEPTLGLDVVAKQAFLESVLFVGQSTDRTIVYCSHQMDEVERVADNLIVLEEGGLVSASTPDQFWQRIRCWVLDDMPPDAVPGVLPGLLQCREIDGITHLIVLDPEADFEARLAGLGWGDARPLEIGFDRAVNAFLTRNHLAPERASTASYRAAIGSGTATRDHVSAERV